MRPRFSGHPRPRPLRRCGQARRPCGQRGCRPRRCRQHRSRPRRCRRPEAAAAATYSGSGSFQSCVIARESGGNSQVMNSSGHYGLYQFSASTWAAYGGSPSSFGNASVAQQNQVFNNAIAAAASPTGRPTTAADQQRDTTGG